MRTRTAPIALAAALVLWTAACGDDDSGTDGAAGETTTTVEAAPPATDDPEADDPPTDEPDGADDTTGDELDLENPEVVVDGLDVPWDLAFVDETTILVTERDGQIRVVEDGELRDGTVADIDVVATAESGLLGIALHPDFDQERFAYVYYTADDDNRLARYPLDDELSFGDEEVLLDGIPAAPTHDGGRIAFGPDGHLYVTTGDANEPDTAADEDSLAGKILRIDADGEIPDDNPFGDSPVYSYGHRNPQGLAWDDDGNLYASEHGPSGEFGLCCHDELNRIEAGGFYGWPFRIGATEADDGEPPAETIEAIATSDEDTWAPSGIAARTEADGTAVYMANLRGEELLRFTIDPDDPDSVTDTEVVLDGEGRLRAAAVGPDDCLYVTTSNTDGRGDPADDDDRLLRFCATTAEDLT